MAEDFERLLAGIRDFDWNPRKRTSNLHDHKIDFEDVKGIFDGYHIIRRSDRHDEIRYEVFGYADNREVLVAFTIRGDVCWIISARRASRKERRAFFQRLARRSATEGKN
ncbi:MAG: BrnT family toxin [Xanthobacteraceae bacterium]